MRWRDIRFIVIARSRGSPWVGFASPHIATPNALTAIERALDRGLPEALREEAWIRRIECLVRLGRDSEARQAAVEHGARYPSSRRGSQIESLLH